METPLYLWLLYDSSLPDGGGCYGSYRSAVVTAYTMEEAQGIHPGIEYQKYVASSDPKHPRYLHPTSESLFYGNAEYRVWPMTPEKVTAIRIGVAESELCAGLVLITENDGS